MLNYFKGNTSRFGSAIQIIPSDFGEYLNAFFNTIVVVVFFLFYFIIEIFLNIVNSFVRKKVYLLTIDFEKAPCKSLIYTRNNKGPNVEPCRIPQVTSLVM